MRNLETYLTREKSGKTFQIRETWQLCYIHAFFISNTFVSNNRLKLVKNQAKAKQQPEAELSLF